MKGDYYMKTKEEIMEELIRRHNKIKHAITTWIRQITKR